MERTTIFDEVIQSSWIHGRARTIAEVCSVSIESRDLPIDPYWYMIGSTKLLDPLTGRSIEQSISVKTTLDQVEMDAFYQLQEWATQSQEGFCLWLSPPHPNRTTPDGRSLRSKLVISQIKADSSIGGRILENRAIVFGDTSIDSTKIANTLSLQLSSQPLRYFTSEDVRQYPIFAQNISLFALLDYLDAVIPEASDQWDSIRTGVDIQIALLTHKWATRYVESYEQYGVGISTEGFLGSRPLSCPVISSPFEVFSRRSLVIEGKYVENCGKCGTEIKKVITKGYQCANCNGIYEGC